MIVPHDRLVAATLDALIEEYVTRDGTELSETSAKSAAVRAALEAGELVVVWDADAESCNILDPETAALAAAEAARAGRDDDD